MKILYYIIGIVVYMVSVQASGEMLPEGFVYLNQIDPTIKVSLRYYCKDNFLGRKVKGYEDEKLIISEQAAQALHKVQQELAKQNLSLLIYDAYRPQQAVDDFISWSETKDEINKKWFYPSLDKLSLFNGYIAKKSGHSRGSRVDLTIINKNQEVKSINYSYRKLPDGKQIPFIADGSVDMGSSFDLLDETSHTDYDNLPESAKINRMFLKDIMSKYNFENYSKEWWRFTLKNEPFKDQYFNFPIR